MRNLLLVFFFMVLSFNLYSQITSAQTGDWSDPNTWVGGVVPGATNDVIIATDHVVAVDVATAECNGISFGALTSKLNMSTATSVLSVYGDFNPFSTSHIPFSNWVDGAVLRFTGDEAVQTITNIRNSNTVTEMAFFKSIVVDKSAGKVTLSGSSDSKFNLSNSLEVINGVFELPSAYDINGRSFNGTNEAYPTITVYSGGTFEMIGGASQICARAVPLTLNKIGKLTVYGNVLLTTTSSNKINFDNVDIESGGILTIKTGWTTGYFNPGAITIKNGGTLYNLTTTNVWDATASVDLQTGGTFRTSSSTTPLPTTFTNNGTFRYSRSAADGSQTILDMDYHRLEISFQGDGTGLKTWTLGDNRTIGDSLEINNSANFQITAATPQTLTVNGTLRLTSGSFDNSDANVILRMGNEALISRATGTLSAEPTYAGVVDVRYTSSVSQVTTGNELPTTALELRDLTIYASAGVILGSDVRVNRNLTLSVGEFDNNGSLDDKSFVMADGSTIRRATGTLTVTPILIDKVNLEYISTVSPVTTGPEVPTNPASLTNVTITSDQGITLGMDMYVNGAMTLTGSSLTTTDANSVILGSTATLTENPGITVIGEVKTTRDVAQSVNNTFGGIGLEINAAGDAPGSTDVIRTTGKIPTGDGNEGIKRWFDITPNTNTGLNATMVFHYDEAELNGITETNLGLFKSDDGGATWLGQGGTVDDGANNVTLAGVDGFSRWTLGDNTAPLPVELTNFAAGVQGQSVLLKWTTAQEINSFKFEIERKTENTNWNKIGEIMANGNSSVATNYSFQDNNLNTGEYSYRLKMIDIDGTFSYSQVVNSVIEIPVEYQILQNYPNPFNPSTRIDYTLKSDACVRVELYSIIGERIAVLVNENQSAGYWTFNLDAAKYKLASGIYLVRFNANDLNSSENYSKVIKLTLNK